MQEWVSLQSVGHRTQRGGARITVNALLRMADDADGVSRAARARAFAILDGMVEDCLFHHHPRKGSRSRDRQRD